VREIADGIKGAKLDFIEESGHLTALEQPERVNKIMKAWLA
jgi:pimeloyl-ACP methyl ester carboxylesterase